MARAYGRRKLNPYRGLSNLYSILQVVYLVTLDANCDALPLHGQLWGLLLQEPLSFSFARQLERPRRTDGDQQQWDLPVKDWLSLDVLDVHLRLQ